MPNTGLLGALAIFVTVTFFTPGPNNLMLMTSGLNFGFRRTQPHALGVALGFTFMASIVGLGLGAVFTAYPAVYAVLKWVGALYLLYLAFVIATSGPADTGSPGGRPLSFLQAAAFQWVNPKGWAIAVGGVSTYAALAPFPFNIAAIAVVFCVIGLCSAWTWVLFGAAMRWVLTHPRAVRIFNIAMALLLVASLYPVLASSA